MKTFKILLIIILYTILIKFSLAQYNPKETSIIFRDYKPDAELFLATDTVKIDFNLDSINDVIFFVSHASTGVYGYLRTINTECKISYLNYFPTDSLSDDSLTWHSGNLNFLGEFNNTEKIGIRISQKASYCYGWINVYFQYVNDNRHIYIDKYAFCTIPDYPLVWGQTYLTGIEEPGIKKLARVFVNQSEKQITVEADKKIKQVKLVNMNGTTVTTINKVNTTSATLNTAGLPGGAYLVQVTLNNGNVQTVKVLLE
jgi:hypothetical protein